jgi:hypothetical protein
MRALEEKNDVLKSLVHNVLSPAISKELIELTHNIDILNKNNIYSKIILCNTEYIIDCLIDNSLTFEMVDDLNIQVKISLRRSGIF